MLPGSELNFKFGQGKRGPNKRERGKNEKGS